MRVVALRLLLMTLPLGCERSAEQAVHALPAAGAPSGAFGKEEERPLIRVEARPPAPARPGESAALEFSFTPGAEVEVPVYPPAYIDEFEIFRPLVGPAGRVAVREFTAEEADRERLSYYEDAPPPLRVEIEVPEGTEPGAYPYRGVVSYFYCFETGGICAKREAHVEGVLDVVAPR